MAILFTFRVFAMYLLRESHRRNIIIVSFGCLTWDFDSGFMSNKPTQYAIGDNVYKIYTNKYIEHVRSEPITTSMIEKMTDKYNNVHMQFLKKERIKTFCFKNFNFLILLYTKWAIQNI